MTRTGRPLERSHILRDLKALRERAGAAPDKAFPRSLRRPFARTGCPLEKDLSRLADPLGRSSVSTTPVYTAGRGFVHARQVKPPGLIPAASCLSCCRMNKTRQAYIPSAHGKTGFFTGSFIIQA